MAKFYTALATEGTSSTPELVSRKPEQKKVKPPRTHWDMLLERRTLEELEEILNERLTEVRTRRGR